MQLVCEGACQGDDRLDRFDQQVASAKRLYNMMPDIFPYTLQLGRTLKHTPHYWRHAATYQWAVCGQDRRFA